MKTLLELRDELGETRRIVEVAKAAAEAIPEPRLANGMETLLQMICDRLDITLADLELMKVGEGRSG